MYLYGALIADVVLVFTFIISILQGFRNGLTRLVFNLVCTIITFIIVLILCKPVTNWVYDNTNIDENFSNRIEEGIGGLLEKKAENNEHIDNSKTNISQPIVDKINSYIDEATERTIDNVSRIYCR